MYESKFENVREKYKKIIKRVDKRWDNFRV